MKTIAISTLLAFIVLFFVFMLIENEKVVCVKRWEESGTSAKWKKDVGCIVEKQPGQWIPESFMRPIK